MDMLDMVQKAGMVSLVMSILLITRTILLPCRLTRLMVTRQPLHQTML